MLRIRLNLFAACLLLPAFAMTTAAQEADSHAREVEWRNYSIPQVEFSRYGDGKAVMFRAPSSWEHQGNLQFKTADGTELHVIVQQIPDGMPLRGYTNSILQGLRDLPGGADSLVVRPTELSWLEAREFFFKIPDVRGRVTRRSLWTAVLGPNAVTLIFSTPETNAAEREPYFKAIVESALIFESGAAYQNFENLRKSAIKDNNPVRIDEIRSIVDRLAGFDSSARAKAVGELAMLFERSPDAVVDLLICTNPIVRGSAIDALSRSSNRQLDQFLVQALGDESSTVAVRAARSLAKRKDVIALLRENSANWEGIQTDRLVRTMPFLDEPVRNQLIDELLKYKGTVQPRVRFGTPPPAPPPPAGMPQGAGAKTTPPVIGSPKRQAPVRSLGSISVSASNRTFDENLEIVIGLLPDLEQLAKVVPLEKLLEDDWVAPEILVIARESGTRLPVDRLIRLLSSFDPYIASLAAEDLANAASANDVARIEQLAAKPPSGKASVSSRVRSNRSLAEELRITVKKIRWRTQFDGASAEARDGLLKAAFADPDIAAWCWRYMQDSINPPTSRQSKPMRGPIANEAERRKIGKEISPLAENILPQNVSLYTAIPDVQLLVDRLGESLSSIQLNSARAQARLTLTFKALEEMLKRKIGVPGGSSVIESAGLKPHSTVVFAKWPAAGTPQKIGAAQRRAMVFRIQDRDRFEQLLANYHILARLEQLPDHVSTGARVFSALPMFLPLAIGAIGGNAKSSSESREFVLNSRNLIGYDNCEGLDVTVFERRERMSSSRINRDTAYVAYVGDAAIVASDWFSLRDCLTRLAQSGESLAGSSTFKQVAADGGDIIYMSHLGSLFDGPASKALALPITEHGALRISKSGWESSFNLNFGARGWERVFVFDPASVKAPSVLLPRSTVAYLLMSVDFGSAWKLWVQPLLSHAERDSLNSPWVPEFEREILAELGPECGVVLLGMPDINAPKFDAPWAFFVQTKSERLARVFAEGKLFKDTPASDKAARVKIWGLDLWVRFKHGYMILASSEAAAQKFDLPEHLNAARDYKRALEKAPARVIAFGGCNIEAATAVSPGSAPGSPEVAEGMEILLALARAFHGLNFYATPAEQGLRATLSVAFDTEGRYPISELASVSKDFQFAAAEVEARGVPIFDQQRIDALTLKITSKAAALIEQLGTDVATASQTVEKGSAGELLVTVRPRRAQPGKKVEIPVTMPELAPFVTPSNGKTDPTVEVQAREIIKDDRDAWSVAQKLADWTFKNLKWKRVDVANAARTLATREADCAEFSELFVAMARAVGLPARIVTGLAHGEGSFGGHAWVEVWAGDWFELDPTWGTHFVDATHIRSTSSGLLAFAALNAINIEVVSTRRSVGEFQKTPASLAAAITGQFNRRNNDALAAALDPEVLVDSITSEGTWNRMGKLERAQVYSALRRLMNDLDETFVKKSDYLADTRTLRVTTSGDTAEALLLASSSEHGMLRLTFVRRGDAWFLRELKMEDFNYNVISESLRPSLDVLQAKRKGTTPPTVLASAAARIMTAREQDEELAVEIADQSLKQTPDDPTLRYLKAVCLLDQSDKTNSEQAKEAERLLLGLVENPVFVPALLKLADYYSSAEGEDANLEKKQRAAIELLAKYAAAVAEDPRPHRTRAFLYRSLADDVHAEAEYRTVLKLDPTDADAYLMLALLLVEHRRYPDALAVVDDVHGVRTDKDRLFANLFFSLEKEDIDKAEELASTAADRMTTNLAANLNLARLRITNNRANDALTLLKRASALDSKNAYVYVMMAESQRQLRKWVLALEAADHAIALDPESGDGYFNRACALAQLRRPVAAIAALNKAVELDEEISFSDDLENEQDLKPLAATPAFKKLMLKLKQEAQPGAEPASKINQK